MPEMRAPPDRTLHELREYPAPQNGDEREQPTAREKEEKQVNMVYVAFDVDGCLIDQDFAPIESTRSLLVLLAGCQNVYIHVWSGSGESHARRVCALLGIPSYVSSYSHKSGQVMLPSGRLVTPDIAFDDVETTTLGGLNVITAAAG